MIFERIGAFTVRWRYPIVAVWIVLVAGITLIAPNLSDVTTSDQATLLPKSAPFNHAVNVHQAAFPESSDNTGVVIVIEATGGEGILNRDAATFPEQIDTPIGHFIADLSAWLASDTAPELVTGVTSPLSSPEVANMTIDASNQVAMIPVSLAEGEIGITDTVVKPVRAWIDDHQPDGVQSYITGAKAIGSAFVDAALSTLGSTLIVTVILVIVLLLLIYRSPVSPLIPLTAVTFSYLVTRGLVALWAESGIAVSTYADILLVVIIYGAGTDYCLFLISRFREEMADHTGTQHAATTTIKKVGETITSSAGTIFVGFTTMIFAKFGVFNTSGPALAVGVLVCLAAGLTLVPATLAILGDRAFWPSTATHRSAGKFYIKTSNLVARRPLQVVIVVVLVMAPLAVYGMSAPLNYNSLSDLPNDVEAKEGFEALKRTLGPGNLSPLTVVMTGRNPADMSTEMIQLEADLSALGGVADVRSLNNPMGQHGEMTQMLRADTQLRLIEQMLTMQNMDAQSLDPQTIGTAFTGMRAYLDHLEAQFPAIADDPNLATLQELFGNVLVFAQRQDEAAPAFEGLAQRFETIEDPYVNLSELTALVPAGSDNSQSASLTQLLGQYVSTDGSSYRMTVILANDPSSTEALDTVLAMRTLVEQYKNGGEAVIDGQSAMTADLRDTLNSDLVLTIGMVSLGIFIVLLLMLRSVVAPLYLIATVGLSYTFTLGLTALVFRVFFGAEDGLAFIIPVFSFVFLVALGVDYSIFLIGRVKEEVGHRGIRDGIHEAVVATGPIITSAGIILAGTFAAMISGKITALAELGFSVAVGVLIDTLVVRTMLVPALTLLLGKWAWWPGGVPRAKDASGPKAAGIISASHTGD
ncbi:MAG TPA: MMPL family transporter [Aggregatilinea sp.]|uniref:MMPL family transporter n=1 Tax=Aggregatilinea sp. TaxID=2806333 RepID=UPI002CEBB7EF|nr:MMPL family transporter [Aggregatilinea sp.]HML20343.1 MMPL family transporter [Aggregatilinea sp.]